MANKKIYRGPNGGLYTKTKTGKKNYISHAALGLEQSRNGSTHFCGPTGGAAKNSYPVNSEKRCRAALSYARFAKRPCGIIACALSQAKKQGWNCGTNSGGAKKCGCKNSKCSRR